MTKKTVGYTRTEWTCPNCQTRNPGPQKTCASCGMPQPENVVFAQAAQEELLTDQAEIAKAEAGADVHCYYCGSRNPAGATACTQCGADLTQGKARESGKVMGGHRTGPAAKITCAACGAENKANAPKCVQCGASLTQPAPASAAAQSGPALPVNKTWIFVAGAILLLCCIGAIVFFVLTSRTSDLRGTVRDASWVRVIAIEAIRPVEHTDWRDEIPAQAVLGTCAEKVRRTQDDPAPNSKEICGTPYTVDKGSGYAKVEQDCKYEVYDEWCKYTVDEWTKVDQISLNGTDLSPQWPAVSALGQNQRAGAREETYAVVFDTEQGQYTYQPSTETEFAKYQVGSRWVLKVNTFNAVMSVEPSP